MTEPGDRKEELVRDVGSEAETSRADRPLGVALLSLIAIMKALGGISLVYTLLVVRTEAHTNPEAASAWTTSLVYTCASIGFSFGCGLGLWLGQKWGWHLLVFCSVFVVVTAAVSFVRVNGMSTELLLNGGNPVRLYGKFLARAMLYGFVLIYSLRPVTVDFFGIEGKDVIREWGVATGLGLATAALVLF